MPIWPLVRKPNDQRSTTPSSSPTWARRSSVHAGVNLVTCPVQEPSVDKQDALRASMEALAKVDAGAPLLIRNSIFMVFVPLQAEHLLPEGNELTQQLHHVDGRVESRATARQKRLYLSGASCAEDEQAHEYQASAFASLLFSCFLFFSLFSSSASPSVMVLVHVRVCSRPGLTRETTIRNTEKEGPTEKCAKRPPPRLKSNTACDVHVTHFQKLV